MKTGELQVDPLAVASESVSEFPLEAFFAGNVRFAGNSVLDMLEDYIRSYEDTLDKYGAKEGHDAAHLKKKRLELEKLVMIAKRLRRDKTELFLHIMPYVREYVRQYGEVGTILINMPISTASDKILYIDFVNNKMIITK